MFGAFYLKLSLVGHGDPLRQSQCYMGIFKGSLDTICVKTEYMKPNRSMSPCEFIVWKFIMVLYKLNNTR